MTLAEVREGHPQVRPVAARPMQPLPQLPGIARYQLAGPGVPEGAKPSDIELRFWNDELWAIIVYFSPADAEDVAAMLRARHGPPAAEEPGAARWTAEGVTLVLARRQRWYGYMDTEINQTVEKFVAAQAEQPLPERRGGEVPLAHRPAPSATAATTSDGGSR